MAVENYELAPLVGLVVIGILAGGGWMIALGQEPEPEPDKPAEFTLNPSPLPNGDTPADEAMQAIAKAGEQGSIRCEVPVEMPVKWPFELAHHDAGILRAVVRTPRGSRLLWPSAEEDAFKPVGILRWSGKKGEVAGCELEPTSRATIKGTVSVEGQAATDVRVRVCGDTVTADAQGAFEADVWAGQHCLVYVSEPGLTQDFAPVTVPTTGIAQVRLEAQKVGATGSATTKNRRVLVPRSSLPERALREEGLSDEAKALLSSWASDSLDEEVARTETAREAEKIEDEAAPATP